MRPCLRRQTLPSISPAQPAVFIIVLVSEPTTGASVFKSILRLGAQQPAAGGEASLQLDALCPGCCVWAAPSGLPKYNLQLDVLVAVLIQCSGSGHRHP